MSDTTSFTLRAEARPDGEQSFREDIAQLEKLNFAGTIFSVLEAGDTSATMRAEMQTGAGPDDCFATTLEDHLVASHGVYLDLEVLPDA